MGISDYMKTKTENIFKEWCNNNGWSYVKAVYRRNTDKNFPYPYNLIEPLVNISKGLQGWNGNETEFLLASGFPDYFIYKREVKICKHCESQKIVFKNGRFVEVKSQNGYLRPVQKECFKRIIKKSHFKIVVANISNNNIEFKKFN